MFFFEKDNKKCWNMDNDKKIVGIWTTTKFCWDMDNDRPPMWSSGQSFWLQI